ncbi:hypothetical protein K402DRAFT_329368 [Aulographum hederae CBS 113979]|uniref:EamA domain-containing protein n=1 Tax=Aulographum hederae CBS 113979 TaxID=1176131 RepID=A0A6G1H4M3_9PEZI|nr:hypothetical protein K402DRAFT_329368 [Aulographum hederae CBS 113979]
MNEAFGLPLAGKKDGSTNTTAAEYLDIPISRGAIRAPSPDRVSNLSIEDIAQIRTGRSLLVPPHGTVRVPSRSPAPPRTWRGRLNAFWVRNYGLAMVLLAQVFGTLMNVTTRLLEIEGNEGKGMHPFQILFARMIITSTLSSTYMYYKRVPNFPFGPWNIRLLLLARGCAGFFGVFGMYYSLLYLPLADATVITFLAPSLACWACSILIKEPFTRMEQIAALISLFGVVLIARPTSFFSAFSSTDATGNSPAPSTADALPALNTTAAAHHPDAGNYDSVTPAQRAMGVGVAMVGVFGAASAYTTIRWIGKRAHPLITVNYYSAVVTIISTIMMFALPGVGFLLPKGGKEWFLLAVLGVCGFVMQLLLTAGLSYEKSSRATNMSYTQMLFALTFDKLVWGTTPGLLSIVGSSLILGSAIYVALHKEAGTKAKVERSSSEEEAGLVDGDEGNEGIGESSVHEVQLRTLR